MELLAALPELDRLVEARLAALEPLDDRVEFPLRALEGRLVRLTSDTPATTADTFLTVPQVAKALQLSTARTYELAREGKLPKVPGLGKQIRIPLRALTAQKP